MVIRTIYMTSLIKLDLGKPCKFYESLEVPIQTKIHTKIQTYFYELMCEWHFRHKFKH